MLHVCCERRVGVFVWSREAAIGELGYAPYCINKHRCLSMLCHQQSQAECMTTKYMCLHWHMAGLKLNCL